MNGKHTTFGRMWAGFTMLSMVLSMSMVGAPSAYANQGQCPAGYDKIVDEYEGGLSWTSTGNYESVILVGGPPRGGDRDQYFAPVVREQVLTRTGQHNTSHVCAKLYTTGSITVEKVVEDFDGDWSFDFTGLDDGFTLTEDDDSKTFDDLELGNYSVMETVSPGFSLDSIVCVGADEVTNGIENGKTIKLEAGDDVTCTFTNTADDDTDPVGSIKITKYACPEDTEVTRIENGVGETVPDDCTLQTGAYFGYVHGTQTDANGPYPEVDAAVTAGGSTDANGVLTMANLPATGRYLVVETDSANTKFAHDALLGLYCEGDGDTSGTNDNQELTFVPENGTVNCVAYNTKPVDDPDPQYCEVTLVSDTKTTVVEKDDASAKVLSTLHSAWTAAISGASWIWGDDPVAPPVDGVTQNFERTFGWNGPVTSAKLTIAADNTFVAELNGDAVGSDLTEFNYVAPAKEYDVTGLIDQGNNELSVEVYNMIHSTDPAVNPAGLLYKLEVKGTDKNCDIPYVETPKQCLVVSDVTTTIGDDNASLTYVHPAWTTELAAGTAEWIWDDSVDPLNGETLTFTKKFNVDSVPTLATLKVAADNGYTATLNGNPLSCDGSGDANFAAVDTCTAPVVAGVNTLTFVATNAPYATTDPEANPSGLIYELTIDGSSCSPVPVDILGCTDDEATNYNPLATRDDGSCDYDNEEPLVCATGENLLVNGGFETPEVTHALDWDIFPSGTIGLGWTTVWAGTFTDAPTVANLEFHAGVNGWMPSEGVQYAELDSDWSGPDSAQTGEEASVRIAQTVATVPGATYELSFEYSPRPGTDVTDNRLEVLVDGTLKDTLVADGTLNGNTVWIEHDYSFEADGASTEIAFRDAGAPNSVGTLLDNAVLCLKKAPDTEVIEMCKYDTQNNPLSGWKMTLSNGEDADETFLTGENGCVTTTVDSKDGPWTVTEEDRDGWMRKDVAVQTGVVTYEGDSTVERGCRFFDAAATGEQEYVCTFMNEAVPAGQCIAPNLIVNGSFETPVVDGDWGIFATVANWIISPDGLELWRNLSGGASDGAQNVELDGTTPTTITQAVPTETGATYRLDFDFSPRVGTVLADNIVDALADGNLVVSASGDGSNLTENTWGTFTDTFVAGDTSTDISLMDKGLANQLGSLVDNVVVCKIANAPTNGGGSPDPTISVAGGGGSCLNCDEDTKKSSSKKDRIPSSDRKVRGVTDTTTTGVGGSQVYLIPTVAGVNAGAGGSSRTPYDAVPVVALLALIASLAIFNRTSNAN